MRRNKYQEALDWLMEGNDSCGTEWDLLQELIDKEMPMKTLHISLLSNPPQNIIACGNCKGNNLGQSFKYCPSCRQKIDWSDEE